MTQDESRETALANHRWEMSKISPCLDPHHCGHFCSGKCVSIGRQKEQAMTTDRDIPERCPCCKADLIHGVVVGMHNQSCDLGTAESLVRELLLYVKHPYPNCDVFRHKQCTCGLTEALSRIPAHLRAPETTSTGESSTVLRQEGE